MQIKLVVGVQRVKELTPNTNPSSSGRDGGFETGTSGLQIQRSNYWARRVRSNRKCKSFLSEQNRQNPRNKRLSIARGSPVLLSNNEHDGNCHD